MARTSNVFARVEPEIKEQAEEILNSLGISMSGAMEMFLRQIVIQGGIPFEVKVPKHPLDINDISKEKFDKMMQKALDDIENGRAYTMEEVEERLHRLYGI